MLVKSTEEDHYLKDLREMFETLHFYEMKLNPRKCVFGVSSGKFLSFIVSQQGVEANLDKIQAILEISPPEECQRGIKPKWKTRNTQQIRLTSNGQMLVILQSFEESF